jgi:hypothetical protein
MECSIDELEMHKNRGEEITGWYSVFGHDGQNGGPGGGRAAAGVLQAMAEVMLSLTLSDEQEGLDMTTASMLASPSASADMSTAFSGYLQLRSEHDPHTGRPVGIADSLGAGSGVDV